MMSVDLHAAQIQGFFDGPVDHLWAMPLLADHISKHATDRDNLTVVSPDMGRVRVADLWADRLGAPLAIIHKRRDPSVPRWPLSTSAGTRRSPTRSPPTSSSATSRVAPA